MGKFSWDLHLSSPPYPPLPTVYPEKISWRVAFTMKRNSFQCVLFLLPSFLENIMMSSACLENLLILYNFWFGGGGFVSLFACVNILSLYDSRQTKGNVFSEHINKPTGRNARAKHPQRPAPGCRTLSWESLSWSALIDQHQVPEYSAAVKPLSNPLRSH